MKFIKDGRLVGSPLQGIEHYDLNRLTPELAFQLDGILRKERSRALLTPDDLKSIMQIRKAVALDKPAPAARKEVPASIQRIGALCAELKEVLK